jgi:hypothetical protein
MSDTKTLPADLVREWRERAAAERRLADYAATSGGSGSRGLQLALYYEMRADELAAAIVAQCEEWERRAVRRDLALLEVDSAIDIRRCIEDLKRDE